jgi:hypothetical protein
MKIDPLHGPYRTLQIHCIVLMRVLQYKLRLRSTIVVVVVTNANQFTFSSAHLNTRIKLLYVPIWNTYLNI